MKLAKENKGITLVVLVITIVTMLIIASVTMYSGISQIDTAEDYKLLSELEIVKNGVYERYANYKKTKNIELLVGTKLTNTEIQTLASNIGITLITIPSSYNEDEKAYYRLTPYELDDIGIKSSEDNYVVNYVTGEVINETKKTTHSGEILYTYARKVFNNEVVTSF